MTSTWTISDDFLPVFVLSGGIHGNMIIESVGLK
jgi:hypothetical protein